MQAANDRAWTCRRQGSRTSRWAAGRPRGGALHPRRGLQPPASKPIRPPSQSGLQANPAPQPNPASNPIRPPSQSGLQANPASKPIRPPNPTRPAGSVLRGPAAARQRWARAQPRGVSAAAAGGCRGGSMGCRSLSAKVLARTVAVAWVAAFAAMTGWGTAEVPAPDSVAAPRRAKPGSPASRRLPASRTPSGLQRLRRRLLLGSASGAS